MRYPVVPLPVDRRASCTGHEAGDQVAGPRPRSSSPRWRTVLWAIVGATALASSAKADDERLDDYLQRLGLQDLRIVHLENRLAETQDPAARTGLGRRLADLYAARLMSIGDQPGEYDRLIVKVRELVAEIPAADTTELRVMLLQADYTRAEVFVSQWLDDRSNMDARREARRLLQQVTPRLQSSQRTLEQQRSDITARLAELDDDEAIAALESELHELQALLLRATYFTGWSSYYLGVMEAASPAGSENPSNGYTAADRAFRSFLDLDPEEDLSELREDWVELDSALHARAFAGLGMVQAALGQDRQCERIFNLLYTPEVAAAVRAEAPFWQLQGWLNAGRIDEAAQLARSVVRGFGERPTTEQSRFCVNLVRFGALDDSNETAGKELVTIGLAGLTRLRQFQLIEELTDQFEIDLSQETGFYLLWARGYLEYSRAEAEGDVDRYRSAASLIARALQSPEAQLDPQSTGHCRYQLGWSLYLSDEWERAAGEFEQASHLLMRIDPETAVKAAWQQYECFRHLSEQEPSYRQRAIDSLRMVQLGFPDSPLARSADYHLARLERSDASLEESIASLEAIAPDNPNYLNARFELCLLHHRRWSQRLAGGEPTEDARMELMSAVSRFLNDSNDQVSDARRLKSLLLVVDVALRSPERDLAGARSYLERAAPLASSLPSSHETVIEYQYQQFQLARVENRDADARSHAEWLMSNAGTSAYVLSALILLAQEADAELEAAGDGERDTRRREAAEIYERLARVLGDDPATLAANRNARVATFRRGQLEFESGDNAAAARRFEALVAALPDNETYLRYAGLAWFRSGSFDEALPHWRKLVTGLPRGSSDWMEAKYHVIACWARIDRDHAADLLRQFRVLFPAVDDPEWESQFARLERELNL